MSLVPLIADLATLERCLVEARTSDGRLPLFAAVLTRQGAAREMVG